MCEIKSVEVQKTDESAGMPCYAWIDYPTETGWWWSKKKGENPEMCCIVAKKTSEEDVVIAIYPERECKLYLDAIYPDIVWQKVKRYVA